MRHLRTGRFVVALLLIAGLGLAVAACAPPPREGASSAGEHGYSGQAPGAEEIGPGASGGSPALRILAPSPGGTVKAGDVEVKLEVSNLSLVPGGGPRVEGEGHVHWTLDGATAMKPARTYTFTDVSKGEHTVIVELVRNDHTPLEPPVRQQVRFTAE